MPSAVFIQDNAGLKQLVKQLAGTALLAVDTESNSLYAYQEQICLIQLSTRRKDYILDPLAITDMQPLGALLANPKIEKIFHSATYDVICLRRQYGFEIHNIFDTMIAARLCHLPEIGLAHVLLHYFDVHLDKSHQTDNWALRPLSNEKLHYAQMDTHYLPRLRDLLFKQLQQLNNLDEAYEVFADIMLTEIPLREFDAEGYWKIALPENLTRQQIAVLREVYILREKIAQADNLPPFKVLTNSVLVAIARAMPTSVYGLSHISGLAPGQIRVYGEDLLAAIQIGQNAPLPTAPRLERQPKLLAERYAMLHAWRRERADQRKIDSAIIMAKQTMWEIAKLAPKTLDDLAQVPSLGAWRLQTYGTELLQITTKWRKK